MFMFPARNKDNRKGGASFQFGGRYAAFLLPLSSFLAGCERGNFF